MSFVFRLPEDLCLEVLNKFVLGKDLATLDSAVSNLETRPLFLQLLSHPYFICDLWTGFAIRFEVRILVGCKVN